MGLRDEAMALGGPAPAEHMTCRVRVAQLEHPQLADEIIDLVEGLPRVHWRTIVKVLKNHGVTMVSEHSVQNHRARRCRCRPEGDNGTA